MSANMALSTPVELDLGLPRAERVTRPRAPRREGPARRHLWIQPVLSDAMLAVGEFHTSFGLPLHVMPQEEVDPALVALRVDLLEEEVAEFKQAATDGDLVAVADALGDIAYVLYGTALTYGINLDAVIAEVHRSNMSKLRPDGKPILREDGKVLKPATYTRPNLRRVLEAQVPLPFQPLNEGRPGR